MFSIKRSCDFIRKMQMLIHLKMRGRSKPVPHPISKPVLTRPPASSPYFQACSGPALLHLLISQPVLARPCFISFYPPFPFFISSNSIPAASANPLPLSMLIFCKYR